MGKRKRKREGAGFTIVELLVVCSLLAIIIGMGAAFLGSMNRVLAIQAEKSRLDALVRQAHNTASDESGRAWLRLDPETNVVEVKAMKMIGQWHFEDEDLVGFPPGLEVTLAGGRLSNPKLRERGKIGRCVVLEGKGGVIFETDHRFVLKDGISLEAWILPYRNRSGMIFKKGAGLYLKLSHGYLEGMVRGVGTVHTEDRKLAVPAHRWSHVKLSFDGRTLEVRVNGALGAVFPPPAKKKKKKKDGDEAPVYHYKPDKGQPLVAGEGFAGRIDELRVEGVIYPHVVKLDPNIRIDPERSTALTIHFGPGGWLDEKYHATAVKIVLADRRKPDQFETLEITRLGTIK